MTEQVYEALGIPDACLVDQRIYKKSFYDYGRLSKPDERIFTEHIHRMTWKYGLKTGNTGIPTHEDGEREYTEVVIIEAVLNAPERVERLAEIMHRAIAYPLGIVFAYEGTTGPEAALSLATKRLNRTGADALVVEDVLTTEWIKLTAMKPEERAFFESVHFAALSHTHFKAWYDGLMDAVRALRHARQMGRFEVATSEEDRRRQQAIMERYDTLQKELKRLQAALKKEHQFNRKVELNMDMRRIKDALQRLSEDGM